MEREFLKKQQRTLPKKVSEYAYMKSNRDTWSSPDKMANKRSAYE